MLGKKLVFIDSLCKIKTSVTATQLLATTSAYCQWPMLGLHACFRRGFTLTIRIITDRDMRSGYVFGPVVLSVSLSVCVSVCPRSHG